jgi:hypothetical protein
MTYTPHSGLWWSTYSVAKSELLSNQEVVNRFPIWLVHMISGVCAGTVATVITNPLDIAKTRIQVGYRKMHIKNNSNMYNSNNNNNGGGFVGSDQTKPKETAFRILRDLVKREGISGLSRGMVARWIGSMPTSLITIVVYEKIKELSLVKTTR